MGQGKQVSCTLHLKSNDNNNKTVNKQIKLQNYCPPLARFFKAGQGKFTVYK